MVKYTPLFFTHLIDKYHLHVIEITELHSFGPVMNDKQSTPKCKMQCYTYSATIRTIVFHSSYR